MSPRLLLTAVLTIVLLASTSLSSGSSTSQPLDPASDANARFDVSALDEQQRDRVQEAVATFSAIGLELPSLRFEFHESTDGCAGHDGFIRYDDTIALISICSDRPYVLLHELAHAWVDARLDASGRAAYVEAWGLESWNDRDHDWADRGTEHAAFIIQQNLTASPGRLTATWLERIAAFEMLTGVDSPLEVRAEIQ